MSRRGAVASVAEPLLAFLREPALVRPAWLHGEMPMPDGEAVLRLALGRVPPADLARFTPREREELHEAAIAFVRQVCLSEKATHYQVLCLPPDARADAIKGNYHLLIALLHPDRNDAHPGAWPGDAAHRANEAHGVLGDAARRRHYDQELRLAAEASPHAGLRGTHHAKSHRRRSRRLGPVALVRRFAIFAAVVASLFVVQAWWVGEPAPEHSLLERAASGRWMRDVLPDAPRFLAAANVAFEPGEPLPPIQPPRRLASLSDWVPLMEASAHTPERPAVPAGVGTPAFASAEPAPLRLAQSTGTAPARPAPAAPETARATPAAATPAAATPANVAGAPTRDDVEEVIAQLVSSYDAGDAGRLVALFDASQLGFWAGYRVRSAYSDFFGATRERRVRVERLGWQPNGTMAQARGEATVIAEYADGRPRLERRVPLEVDIALRDGKPRIARLVLFPLPQ